LSKFLRFLWRINALKANFVLGFVVVQNCQGIAIGHAYHFALNGSRTQAAAKGE
jgi:hypothetical protein